MRCLGLLVATCIACCSSLPWRRELLGKYAASSGGGLSLHPLSSAPASGTPRLGSGGGGPRGATPSYLSPAFQLAAMEQEVQMAHASAAAAQHSAAAEGGTPPAAPGWQADDASELAGLGGAAMEGGTCFPQCLRHLHAALS